MWASSVHSEIIRNSQQVIDTVAGVRDSVLYMTEKIGGDIQAEREQLDLEIKALQEVIDLKGGVVKGNLEGQIKNLEKPNPTADPGRIRGDLVTLKKRLGDVERDLKEAQDTLAQKQARKNEIEKK